MTARRKLWSCASAAAGVACALLPVAIAWANEFVICYVGWAERPDSLLWWSPWSSETLRCRHG